MASQIHPVGPNTGQIEYGTEFTKVDGSKGVIEPGSFQASLSDGLLGDVIVDSDNATVKVRHNGAIGTAVLTGRGDGNVDPGDENVAMIVFTETITFLAPLGAVAGAFTLGVEGPLS